MSIPKTDIVIPPAAHIHMLRHFLPAEAQLIELMASLSVTRELLDLELAVPGSRFHPSFASSIDMLLDRLPAFPVTENIGLTGNRQLQFEIPGAAFPDGIGTLAVLPVSCLKEDEQKRMYRMSNRGLELWQLDVDELPVTSICSLILRPQRERFVYITAFPGPPTPPLPEAGMESSLRELCRSFWNNHVFLKQKAR
jgi:hypothetical protein